MTIQEQHTEEETSFFERVGGHETFSRLMSAFFDEVRKVPSLAALYPADDWQGAEERLLMFFEQYFGGPHAYSMKRGAPMLKMRHMPYRVTPEMRDHWVRCMRRAMDRCDLHPDLDAYLHDYVERAGTFLINAD